jgi:hypothetical protein
MPFYVSYRLGSSPCTLFADSAAEALLLYHELRTQQARPIKIRDETGAVMRPEQLGRATGTRKAKNDRTSRH